MKNPKTILIAVGALALIAIGFLFVRGPKPIIEIKAETLAEIGFFPIVNTWVTSTLVVIVLITLAYFATRKLTLIPSGLQNAVEAVVSAMYDICISTAGEKNGRRFFPVIMTIFTFIWIANWMALLPFFNAIGSFQKVDAHHFHEEAVLFSSTGGLSFIPPNSSEIEFELNTGAEEACTAEHTGAEGEECAEAVRAFAIAEALEKENYHTDVEGCGAFSVDDASGWECFIHSAETGIERIDEDGKKLGILIPYFRSMNTDINSPLSIAIMAMIFIEFWGITTLGVFKYAGKFFNVTSPINFFVGILEFIAEIARIISFTFRLFGNMLAGEILLLVMTFLVPFLVAIPFYGLEVFVGVIQAFVFAMLTLVFAVLAVSSHEGHDEPGGHDEDRPMEGPVPVMHEPAH